jgi:hypothetical protein
VQSGANMASDCTIRAPLDHPHTSLTALTLSAQHVVQ